ncbi:unnamed protein product [Microthlaspi erraticum]|uniref:Uncharacterized protein n=1 Tax=Microthlaspi erraticum TaxID=1685480 RepID=A0A6D2HPA5_9BRAS|nr:unnamed protein product [Microthlaspi erraticum]
MEEGDFLIDSSEECERLRMFIESQAVRAPRRARAKRKRPDPAGSTLSTQDSLDKMKSKFRISGNVKFVLPSPQDRADEPPPGHITLYESFVKGSLLWFLLPNLIVRYLRKYGLAFSQIAPRGLRHLVGILVRSFECRVDLQVSHFQNLQEIRGAKRSQRYYLSSKRDRRVITGFPEKDHFWDDYFLYVLVDEFSVQKDCLSLIRTTPGPLVRRYFPHFPDNLFEVQRLFASKKVDWKRDFNFERVERARAARSDFRVFELSDDPSPTRSELRRMMAPRPSFRDKRERERKQTSLDRFAPSSSAKTPVVPSSSAKTPVVPSSSAKTPVTPRTDEPRLPPTLDLKKKGRSTPGTSKVIPPPSDSQRRAAAVALPPPQEGVDAPSRKRLVPDKDAPSHSTEKKKKRVADSEITKDGEPNRDCAAVRVVSRSSSSSRVGFLSVDALSQPTVYGEMSSQGSRLVEFINKMVLEYEEKARKDFSRLGDEVKKVADLNKKLLATTSKNESELENAIDTLTLKHETEMDLSVSKAARLEKENAALRNDSELKSDILAAAELQKGKVEGALASLKDKQESAVRGAREALECELTDEFQSKIAKVRLALRAIADAKDKEVELAQMEANLEFIDLLQGAKPPSLDAEVVKLNGYKVELGDAYGKHEDIVAGLIAELGLLPFTPISSPVALDIASKFRSLPFWSSPVIRDLEIVVDADPKPAFDAEPAERIAESVGVIDQHGTNMETRADGDAELEGASGLARE